MVGIRSLGAGGVVFVCLNSFAAEAQGTRCLGSLQIGNNLAIAGQCELADTEVRGNVTLFGGGSLTARNVRIRGNLEGSRANFVDMTSSRVDGRIRLEEFVGDLMSFETTEVRGDVALTSNRSRLEILNNDFRGNVEVRSNTGGVLISGNSVEDDLICTGNSPAPVGTANRVEGDSEGQCETLQAQEPEPTPPPPSEPPPSEPPPTTPPPETPPPTTPPPTSSPPPTPTPAPTTPDDPLADEGGGAGSFDWLAVLTLLPLLAWRRRARPRAS